MGAWGGGHFHPKSMQETNGTFILGADLWVGRTGQPDTELHSDAPQMLSLILSYVPRTLKKDAWAALNEN